MSSFSGFGGRVQIGSESLVLPASHWNVQWQTELVDATTSSSGSVHEYVLGYDTITASFDCFWNQGIKNVLALNSTPSLRPGTSLTVELYVNRDDVSNRWYFPTFIVESCVMDTSVRDVVRYTITGKQNGNSTFPFSAPLIR